MTPYYTFIVTPELLAWLRAHRQDLEKYIFPEFIFLPDEQPVLIARGLLPRLRRFVAWNYNHVPTENSQETDPAKNLLQQGSKEDIHLLCLSPGRNGKLVAYAFDGQMTSKSERHRVAFATGVTNPAKAKQVAVHLVEALKKQWEKTYGK
jgi:hypothetical protein